MNKFLAGGAGYAIMLLLSAALIGGVWFKYSSAIDRAEQAEADLVDEKAITASQRITIGSQARSDARRSEAGAMQQNTEDAINEVPDSTKCYNSEPIRRGFDILRNNAEKPDDSSE